MPDDRPCNGFQEVLKRYKKDLTNRAEELEEEIFVELANELSKE